MLNRRLFLGNGLLAGFYTVMDRMTGSGSKTVTHEKDLSLTGSVINGFGIDRPGRLFIAHRGVNLSKTIAGENSLEAIRLAKRAGFGCVEFDIRLTSDGHAVVMHDDTLNRTTLNPDGSPLSEKIYVSNKTLQELKNNYILQATEKRNRTKIPTFREFLSECRKCEVIPFIEIKLRDQPDQYYRDVIKEADRIMGKHNYILTSNNQANEIVRRMSIRDITLMGILYQSSFGKIESLGNIIMAISTSRFSPQDYATMIERSNLSGMLTESHADDFSKFSLIDEYGVDFVSTDKLAPDSTSNNLSIVDAISDGRFIDYEYSGKLVDGTLSLDKDETLKLKQSVSSVYFGAIFLELEMKGSCKIKLADQDFTVSNETMKEVKHQLMVYDSAAAFSITAISKSVIKQIRIKITRY